VWLALAIGLLQTLICAVKLFSSGWAAPFVFFLMLLPFVPLILIWEIGVWQKLRPEGPRGRRHHLARRIRRILLGAVQAYGGVREAS